MMQPSDFIARLAQSYAQAKPQFQAPNTARPVVNIPFGEQKVGSGEIGQNIGRAMGTNFLAPQLRKLADEFDPEVQKQTAERIMRDYEGMPSDDAKNIFLDNPVVQKRLRKAQELGMPVATDKGGRFVPLPKTKSETQLKNEALNRMDPQQQENMIFSTQQREQAEKLRIEEATKFDTDTRQIRKDILSQDLAYKTAAAELTGKQAKGYEREQKREDIKVKYMGDQVAIDREKVKVARESNDLQRDQLILTSGNQTFKETATLIKSYNKLVEPDITGRQKPWNSYTDWGQRVTSAAQSGIYGLGSYAQIAPEGPQLASEAINAANQTTLRVWKAVLTDMDTNRGFFSGSGPNFVSLEEMRRQLEPVVIAAESVGTQMITRNANGEYVSRLEPSQQAVLSATIDKYNYLEEMVRTKKVPQRPLRGADWFLANPIEQTKDAQGRPVVHRHIFPKQ